MRSVSLIISALTLSIAAALPAAAQDRSFNFALRGGLAVGPE